MFVGSLFILFNKTARENALYYGKKETNNIES